MEGGDMLEMWWVKGCVWVLVWALGSAGVSAAAFAQTTAAPHPPASHSSDRDVLNGLSSANSGRVGDAKVQSYGADIAAGIVPEDAPETSVSSVASKAVTPAPVGDLDVEFLASEIAAKFEALDHCRTNVARTTGVAPARIVADTLTLRWTILGTGHVAKMEVIGSTPVDAEVLDCVKREANGWRFRPPAGGNLAVERVLVFRPLSPAVHHE